MPYIQYELAAMESVPCVARAAGIPESSIGWGLPLMWRWCWQQKRSTVCADHLGGFFGGDGAKIGAALVAFGFAENEGPEFRIKGAERYLRIAEAKARGAAATNAKKKAKTADVRRTSDAAATHMRRITNALTLSTDQLSIDKEEEAWRPQETAPPRASPLLNAKEAKKAKPEKPADPRLTPLTVELVEAFRAQRGAQYKHGGAKDTEALKRILATGASDDEVLRRWKRGLQTANEWYRVHTFTGLDAGWNKLSEPIPEGKINGRSSEAEKDWSKPQAVQVYADGSEGLVFR